MELPFKGPEFEKAWSEWLDYRKQRRLPKYVETGLKKTFTHLKNISDNDSAKAIQIIDYSISQNYQGLHPLKNGTYQQTTGKGQPGTSEARIAALKKW